MRSAFHEIRKFVDHSANDFVDDASVEQARFDVGRHYSLGVETSAQAAPSRALGLAPRLAPGSGGSLSGAAPRRAT